MKSWWEIEVVKDFTATFKNCHNSHTGSKNTKKKYKNRNYNDLKSLFSTYTFTRPSCFAAGKKIMKETELRYMSAFVLF